MTKNPETPRNNNALSDSAESAKRLFQRRGAKVVIGAAGLMASAGLLSACGPDGEPSNSPTPTVTTETPIETPSATPSPTETETTNPENPESLRIPADLPAEQLAEAANNLWTAWVFAGATEDTIATTMKAYNDAPLDNFSVDGFIEDLAQKNADFYSQALMVDDWIDQPDMQRLYDNSVDQNKKILATAIKRSVENSPQIVEQDTITNVVEKNVSDGKRSITFNLHQEFINNTEDPTDDYLITFNFDTSTGSAQLFGFSATEQ